MLCFCFGSSRQSLKVREVKYIPGDPTITCPVLFKGSRSLLSLVLLYVAYCTLRPYLVRQYLVFCWPCCVMLVGTVLYIHLLVCAGLSLFIISGLYVYVVVCIVYAYNLTKSCGKFCGKSCGKSCGKFCWESSRKFFGKSCRKFCGKSCGKSCGKFCRKSCGKCCRKSCGKLCGKSCRKFPIPIPKPFLKIIFKICNSSRSNSFNL